MSKVSLYPVPYTTVYPKGPTPRTYVEYALTKTACEAPIVFDIATKKSSHGRGRESITLTRDHGSSVNCGSKSPSTSLFINLRNRVYDLQIHRNDAEGPLIGTANFSHTGIIDFSFLHKLRGGRTQLKPSGFRPVGNLFVSKTNFVRLPAAPGATQEFCWKGSTRRNVLTGTRGELVLVDLAGRECARLVRGKDGATGRLEIVVGRGGGVSLEFADQIAVSGVAIWEKSRRDMERMRMGVGSHR